MSEPGKQSVPNLESLKQQLAAGFAQLRDRIAAGGAEDEVVPEALDVLVKSLGAVGGAVWSIEKDGTLHLEYQLQLGETGLLAHRDALERHGRCLLASVRNGQHVVIPAGAQDAGGESINPTACVLLAGLSCADRQNGPFLIFEALQRPATFDKARAGQLRVLEQVCGIVSEFLRARLGKQAESRQALVSQVERFTREAHLSLDSKLVAYSIANEGRTLIGCDRVSVAVRHGGKFRLTAVSGVPEIARRANSVRLAEGLIRTVMASGDPLWFEGDEDGLPPQITKSLDAFVDESHARSLAVIPLRVPPKADAEDEGVKPKRARPEPPVGAILVEIYGQQRLPEGFRERTEVVAEHAAIALANAVAVESVFLMPVWRALGKVTGLFRGRTLPKTLSVLALIGGLLAGAILVEVDFELHAPGAMEPAIRHDVFAETDGVVDEVLTEHGRLVAPGDKLAILRNDELDLQLTGVVGKRQETEKSIESISASLLSQKDLPPEQRNRLSSEQKSLEKSLEGLHLQETLLRKRAENLVMTSPAQGQVTTWDVTRLLMARPVQRGQVLMSVADLTGPWVLELRVPEHRLGHIGEAWRAAQIAGKELPVKFVLSTDPNEERQGVVQKIASRAEIDELQEHTVLVTVTFDKASVPEHLLRPGAAVTGKVLCGRQPFGYVWLHDVLEWFQREILFRL